MRHPYGGAAAVDRAPHANAYIYTAGTAPAEQVSLATGAVTYLNTDSLGSVRGIISSSGALTATTSYDAWGNPQASGGLTAYTPFGFGSAISARSPWCGATPRPPPTKAGPAATPSPPLHRRHGRS
jgi:hypothetical protein